MLAVTLVDFFENFGIPSGVNLLIINELIKYLTMDNKECFVNM